MIKVAQTVDLGSPILVPRILFNSLMIEAKDRENVWIGIIDGHWCIGNHYLEVG